MFAMMEGVRPKATLFGDYDLLRGLGDFLGEIGFTVENRICNHSLQDMPEAVPEIVYPASEEEKLAVLKSLKGNLVLGDDIAAHVVSKDNTCLTVSSPIFRQRQIATHLPIMGMCGADWLMEAVYQYLMR